MNLSNLEFVPVEINHTSHFKKIIDKFPPQFSEHTFTNIFIWRNHYSFRWAKVDNCILLLAKDDKGSPYFFAPFGMPQNPTEFFLECLEYLKPISPNPRIERVPSYLLTDIETKELVILPDRDQFDYVYRASDLAHLAGRNYHAKKNNLNKFLKKYSWSYERITAETVQECLQLEEEWCDFRQCSADKGLSDEMNAIRDALLNMDILGIIGGAIRVNGKIEAFSLGEPLNKDTAVIHIEKANPQIEGLYTAINYFFVRHEFMSFAFINREQDLGLEGLRKAKESYHPVKMVEKFTIKRT